MTRRILRLHPPPPEPTADAGFAQIRAQFEIPEAFPAEVLAAAEQAATRPLDRGGYADLRAVEFFTVDPPRSLDLDQAMHLERRDGGYRVRYAIADVAAFVDRGGAIEAEAWRRGETVYCPDIRIPLYPTVLSEGAAEPSARRRPAGGGVHDRSGRHRSPDRGHDRARAGTQSRQAGL